MSARPVTTLPNVRLRQLEAEHDRLRRVLAAETNRGDRRGASAAARLACEVARLLDVPWRRQASELDFAFVPLLFDWDGEPTRHVAPRVLAEPASSSLARIARINLAEADLAFGRADEAVARMDGAVTELESANDPKTLGESLHARGNARLAARDLAGAVADFERAECCATGADPGHVAALHFSGDATLAAARLAYNALDARGSRGLSLAALGRFDEGATLVEEVLVEVTAIAPQPVQLVLENRARLAAVRLRQGRTDIVIGPELREIAAGTGHRRWYRELLEIEAALADARGEVALAATRRDELVRLHELLGRETAERMRAQGPLALLRS